MWKSSSFFRQQNDGFKDPCAMGWWNQGWLCPAPQPGALWLQGKWGLGMGTAGRGQILATIHLPTSLGKDKTTPFFSAAWHYSVNRTYFSLFGFAIQSLRCFWLLQSLSSLIHGLKGSLAVSEAQIHDPSALRVHLSCPDHKNMLWRAALFVHWAVLGAHSASVVICTSRASLGADGCDESKEEDMLVLN